MAKIKSFYIENFKGIEATNISISDRIDTPIITLIGLNESGKTTVLEALSHFVSGDAIVAKIFEETGPATKALSLIPIHKKANFTGDIKVGARIALDTADIDAIKERGQKHGLDILEAPLRQEINVWRQYAFSDGNLDAKRTGARWDIDLQVRKPKAKHYTDYTSPADGVSLNTEVWKIVLSRLPSISYFPTFLVEMPDRIYISHHDDETSKNRYYRSVLQSVLDSLNEGLDLDTHVAERIFEYHKANQTATWISTFWGTQSKSQVQSVFQKASNAISREIIGSWNKIFHRPTSAKSISLDWNIDTEKGNLPYVTFNVSDGESQYALHERSLGFRWFFSFLLFTRFKQSHDGETIFLFDEPAANLHALAQSELLDSFNKIVEGGHKVVYSTHSHHMIEPRWLSGAYIIENRAIDYENDFGGLNSRPTDILAKPYRQFVSEFPDRVSYYQPVIEKLGSYSIKLAPEKPVVVTEGITDFHALSAICGKTLKTMKFDLVPGLGAGSSSPIISFLLATGRKFLVLLDDDAAGKREARRYKEQYLLPEDTVITLAALNKNLSGKSLEDLLSTETHGQICLAFSKQGQRASKKEVGAYFAERNFGNARSHVISKETERTFMDIIKSINDKF